jgi:hypothetical protein
MSFSFNVPRPSGFASGPVASVYRRVGCCEDDAAAVEGADSVSKGRTRLHQLNGHLHCSILGTCLGTAELRKLVSKLGFADALHASDLEVHHEAVSIAGDKLAGKALSKALDKRHEAALQAFDKARDAAELEALWRQALRSGAIPGAYWALMSHRHATPELRQRAFGEVHMLSHLVGAANRADIRRLAALEQENADWRERAERQQARVAELQEEQRQWREEREQLLLEASAARSRPAAPALEALQAELAAQAQLVALQAQRREAAEQALLAERAREESLAAELERARQLAATLGRELQSVESHLQLLAEPEQGRLPLLDAALRGRRLLYVGGRPSSTPALRRLSMASGAEFIHHDGGLEDRKGLLAAALAGADLVAFPVDCIDHDSALNLKRLCARHGVPFVALRNASLSCFLASITAAADAAGPPVQPRVCLRHA